MTASNELIQRIEADEDSVRDSRAGCGRLLDDLRSVPHEEVRAVFEAVYAKDRARDKQVVIDLSQGELVIADPFKCDNQSKATKGATESGILTDVHDAFKDMSWYEKLLTGIVALKAQNVINNAISQALESAKKVDEPLQTSEPKTMRPPKPVPQADPPPPAPRRSERQSGLVYASPPGRGVWPHQIRTAGSR
jgi:hypothetical protein